MRQSEGGNVVMFILLAVGLFGALAFAFTRGSQQGQGNMNEQQAKVYAGDVLSTIAGIQKGVNKLRQRGCSENQLNFTNIAATTVDYANGNSPVDKSCHLYDAAGAGLTFPSQMSDGALVGPEIVNATTTDWFTRLKGQPVFLSRNDITGNGIPDLYVAFPFINKQICENAAKLATGNPTITSNNVIGYLWSWANGTFTLTPGMTVTAPEQGCHYKANDRFYVYYMLLIGR